MFEKIIVVRGYLALIILFLFILGSCTKEPQYIPTAKESDNLYIVETDTLQPVFTVYRLDSFQTSGSNRAIIGENSDPYFGLTKAKSYCRFKIALDNYQTVGLPSQFYDSVALVMHTDKSYYGDTSVNWSASVHILKQYLDAVNGNYYNHNQLLITPDELGNTSVRIRPNVDDSVRIKLSDSFGSEIFSLYKRGDLTIQSQDAFQQFFKGLSIESGTGNNAIYGFNAADTSMYIRIYYHDDQGIHINKTLDFKSEGGNYQFNNIINDPSGTITETLVAGHDLLSSQLGHQVFINDLAGVGTKFTLPSIKALPTIPDFVRLESAQLRLAPMPESFRNYPLISYLGLGASNESSSALTPVYTSDNTLIQNGNLFIDQLKGTETAYQYDLSALSRNEITSTVSTTNTIFFQPLTNTNSRSFSLQRLVAADVSNTTVSSKFILQLLFFKK